MSSAEVKVHPSYKNQTLKTPLPQASHTHPHTYPHPHTPHIHTHPSLPAHPCRLKVHALNISYNSICFRVEICPFLDRLHYCWPRTYPYSAMARSCTNTNKQASNKQKQFSAKSSCHYQPKEWHLFRLSN